MKIDKRKCDRCGVEFEQIVKEFPPYEIKKKHSIEGIDISTIHYQDEDYCPSCLDSFYNWRNMK